MRWPDGDEPRPHDVSEAKLAAMGFALADVYDLLPNGLEQALGEIDLKSLEPIGVEL